MVIPTISGGGICDSSVLSIEDFSQDMELRIIIKHMAKDEFDEEKYPKYFRVIGKDTRGVSGSLSKKRKSRETCSSPASSSLSLLPCKKSKFDSIDGVVSTGNDEVTMIDCGDVNASSNSNDVSSNDVSGNDNVVVNDGIICLV